MAATNDPAAAGPTDAAAPGTIGGAAPPGGASDAAGGGDARPWVLIPSYQPDARLVKLVGDLFGLGAFGGVIVVNDGSSPERAKVFDELRGRDRLWVVDHAVNRGKGQALKTGLNHYLLTAPPASSGLLCCDADGQHLAADAAKVAAAGGEAGAFTLGTRSFGSNTPFRSRLGNTLSTFFFTLFTGSYIKDTQTGLRFIPRSEAAYFIGVPYDRFDYEFAALVSYVSDRPGRMRLAPIETVYLEGNASHFRDLKDTITIGGVFVRFFSLSISTAIVDYLVFILAYHLSAQILTSFICARLVSIAYTFTLSRKLVFKSRGGWRRQLIKYVSLVAAFLLVSWYATELLSGILGGYVVLCKAISEASLFVLSFFIQRRFIFSRASSR
jgi:putative flippase GtrA